MSYRHQHAVVHQGTLSLFFADQDSGEVGMVGVEVTRLSGHKPISTRGAVSACGELWQTWIDHDGYAHLRNLSHGPVYSHFPRTFGAGTVAIRMVGEDPELYLMREGDGSTVYVYNLAGEELRKYARSPTTQRPLWKILRSGTPLLGNDPERSRVMVMPDGTAFYDWDETEDGKFICGAGDGWNGERNAPCIMVRNNVTDETRCCWFQTAELPWIVSLPDGPRLILSGENPPAPLSWDQLSPWETVRPETPHLPEMSFPQTVRPIFRGCLGWDGGPGNFAGGRKHNGRWIIEGTLSEKDGTPWILPEDEGRVLGLFISPFESQNYPAEKPRIQELAQRTGAPVLMYADRPTWQAPTDDVWGTWVNIIPTVRCYPTEPGDTAESVVDRLRTFVDRMKRSNIGQIYIGVVRPLYAQPQWSETETARLNLLLTEYIETEPAIAVDIAFGWKRQQGSETFKQWAHLYFAELCTRTPEPSRATLPRTFANPPKPEPQPAPVEPKTPPPAQNEKPKAWWQTRVPPKPQPKLPFRERLRIILEAIRGRKAS